MTSVVGYYRAAGYPASITPFPPASFTDLSTTSLPAATLRPIPAQRYLVRVALLGINDSGMVTGTAGQGGSLFVMTSIRP